MSENLNKKPPKGILKSSSSFDTNKSSAFETPRCSITSLVGVEDEAEEPLSPGTRKIPKSAKFDEMNILETLHPADKDYGHMKIEEPKTPFNYYDPDPNDQEEDEAHSSQSSRRKGREILLDPEELAKKISEKGVELPAFMNEDLDLEDLSDPSEDDDPQSKAKKYIFESKRKAHYNEYFAVKLARQLMDKDGDEEEEKGGKFIPEVETEVAEEEEEAAAAENMSTDP